MEELGRDAWENGLSDQGLPEPEEPRQPVRFLRIRVRMARLASELLLDLIFGFLEFLSGLPQTASKVSPSSCAKKEEQDKEDDKAVPGEIEQGERWHGG